MSLVFKIRNISQHSITSALVQVPIVFYLDSWNCLPGGFLNLHLWDFILNQKQMILLKPVSSCHSSAQDFPKSPSSFKIKCSSDPYKTVLFPPYPKQIQKWAGRGWWMSCSLTEESTKFLDN
jgi:hypothetical protein